MGNVICLATGSTYEMVERTSVTAHPACAPYPRCIPDYMIPIRKGGYVDKLYNIKAIIECLPDEVYEHKSELSEKDFSNLIAYHEQRKATFGYSKTDEKYRFYVCSELYTIDPSYRIKGIMVSKIIDIGSVPIIK